MPPPQTTHIFTLRVQAGTESLNASHPQSKISRHITSLVGGFLRGVPGTRAEGFNATLVTGGSDWVLRDEASNIIHLDVRTQGRTDSGDGVYIQYKGHLVLDKQSRKFMSRDGDAEMTAFGDHDWWVVVGFEVSDPGYEWVQRTMFFGRGRFYVEGDLRAVEYEVFAVQN
ncbi:hypothetical protein BO94DRAFT_527516 [Aspergillus sclerotioniger CBS 115572]|uniref:Uncharacterized protein n=1 Tax=Aspergillus sclerotioniger CBS 115572 TaxID=1450535 RepID=A0A317V7H0_9EURO|nr:hypothetical protein BO94DRAFT_527516 [Aspergillus sclerotioniger CBS 115572]PWY68998.1 hypothetical protein BO94DRAFT_527516 [Aspergillus sclerotioniger CBS 115572]